MCIPESYRRQIAKIHRELGIDPDYGRSRHLRLQPEAQVLSDAGTDVFGRPQQLAPDAEQAWETLKTAVAREGIELALVSAFRSVDYQRRLIERKLAAGQAIKTILAVNAAPGYSEHHAGRAVDVTTTGAEPLDESFEGTRAFRWLQERGSEFGFTLSFPRGNPHGIAYEPWHWLLR